MQLLKMKVYDQEFTKQFFLSSKNVSEKKKFNNSIFDLWIKSREDDF